MSTLITIYYIAICVILFSLAIGIHEFGHFIVALKLGLKVEAFSIGFGPVLWKKTWKGVEYRLSAIPLGGYVSLPDIDPEGTQVLESGKGGGEKNRIAPWKEILVAFAGPFMNIVMAVVLALILAIAPGARFGVLPSILGEVPEKGPAAEAGLQAGDRIVAVGEHPVASWAEMLTEIQLSGGMETMFEVERLTDTTAGGYQTHSPRLIIPVTPARDPVSGAYYIMALSTTNQSQAAYWMPDRNPIKQLAYDAGSIFRILKALVTPKNAKATAGALGGPVMIAESIYRSVRRDAWDGLGFLRFLSMNLAILNLLPIPVLDGGLIMFSMIALVFRRRLPDCIVKYITIAFMWLLIVLMGVLVMKDSYRSWKIHHVNAAQ